MPAALKCPDPQQWRRLLLGDVSDQEAEQLEQHLNNCPQCGHTLNDFKADDTLIEALRTGCKATARPPIEKIAALIEKLKNLPSGGELDRTEASHERATVPDGAEESFDFLTPPQQPGELGRLGGYRVLKVLGQGGMGVVFHAEDPQLKRPVALKAMKPALATNTVARQRFVIEAQATAAVKHDHIITIYQVGIDRNVPFLAMEFLKGQTLDDRLKAEEKLPLSDALRIGREIAEGLSAAHENGLIHRDIKPGNLWLEGRKQRVKILDFGLARAVGQDVHLTQSGTIVGTPAYMAPEQAKAEKVDARCDLFSLGCVLYRMVTGELPFKGRDTMSMLLAVALDHPRPPQELNPAVPPALNRLILNLLSKKASERPVSAAVVATVLESIEKQVLAKDTTVTPAIASKPTPPAISVQPPKSAPPAVPVRQPKSAPPAVPVRQPKPVLESTTTVADSVANKPPASKHSTPMSLGVSRRKLLIGAWLIVAAVFLFGIVVAGVIVIQLSGGEGTVTIETVDPDIEVSVKKGGQEVVILDPKTNQQVTLKAGKYEVEFKKGGEGLILQTRNFTLKRGDTVVVKVTWDPEAKAQPPKKTPDSVPDTSKPASTSPREKPASLTAPFTAQQAKEAQKAWAKYLGRKFEEEIDLGGGVKLEVVLIPPGTFTMGSPIGEANRRPNEVAHQVSITQPFYLGKYPVTQQQYDQVMGKHQNYFQVGGGGAAKVNGLDTKLFPVQGVSFEDADKFCQTAGKKIVLPTEAQWEYACRAGTTTAYFFGDDPDKLGDYAWYNSNSEDRTHVVGEKKKPNAFGLHDMHGNVCQWCMDYYGPYEGLKQVDPVQLAKVSGFRVNRGGFWALNSGSCRAACRVWGQPDFSQIIFGLRVAVSIQEPQEPAPVKPAVGQEPARLTAPFTAKQAKEAQEAWANYLGRKVEEEIDLGGGVKMEVVLIPKGKFKMGSPQDEKGRKSDEREHDVEITKPFYLEKYPVTQEQYQAITGKNPSYFSKGHAGGNIVKDLDTKQFPVEYVSWSDAQAFCKKLRENDKQQRQFRLPTEAEWEYACRAGTTTPFYFGSELNGKQANCHGDSPYGTTEKGPYKGRPTKVGEYGENPWRLCDMHGNLAQWCEDYYGPYEGSNVKDPLRTVGPSEGQHILRGGSWDDSVQYCRAASRASAVDGIGAHIGFRVAVSIQEPQEPAPVKPAVGQEPAQLQAPFTAKQAKEAQEAWAKYLGRKVEEEIDLGGGVKLELVLIPPGTFMMGSPKDEIGHDPITRPQWSDEKQHTVEITKPFYLGKYLVTQQQYGQLMPKHQSYFQVGGGGAEKVKGLDTSRFPVDQITWDEAQAFGTAAGKKAAWAKEGGLPSEAQWEYACRAGTTTLYFFGEDFNKLHDYAWYFNNADLRSHVVGEKKPNAFGLYDMLGNLMQWCMDYCGPYDALKNGDTIQLDKIVGDARVVRGCYWASSQRQQIRSAARFGTGPGDRQPGHGFRVAIAVQVPHEPPPPPPSKEPARLRAALYAAASQRRARGVGEVSGPQSRGGNRPGRRRQAGGRADTARQVRYEPVRWGGGFYSHDHAAVLPGQVSGDTATIRSGDGQAPELFSRR